MKHKKSGGFVEGHKESVGKGSFANLPHDVVMKEYPKSKSMRGGMLDDTITGIDSVQRGSESKSMHHISNQK